VGNRGLAADARLAERAGERVHCARFGQRRPAQFESLLQGGRRSNSALEQAIHLPRSIGGRTLHERCEFDFASGVPQCGERVSRGAGAVLGLEKVVAVGRRLERVELGEVDAGLAHARRVATLGAWGLDEVRHGRDAPASA
jgi:hypothetical protein